MQAGKRNIYSNGNSSPEALFRIKKDIKSMAIRSPSPATQDFSNNLKFLHEDIRNFSSKVSDFKKQQASDFSELWASLRSITDLIKSP